MSKNHATSPHHIQRHRDLLKALDRKRSKSQLDLHARLKKCEGPDWGHRFTCRSPACPRCRDRYIARQRRDTQRRFQGIVNTELAMVSIVLGASSNIWDVGHIIDKGRRDLRNLVNRRRQSSASWNDFEIVGWLEVDAYDPVDLHLLGDKCIQLNELLSEMPSSAGPIWSPTIHAIVRVPSSLNHDDVRSAFKCQWPCHHQVDLTCFHLDKTANTNIGNIVNYAIKHDCLTGPSGFQSSWDTSWQVQFYDWLHQFSRGFHSIRVSMKPRRANGSDMICRTVSCADEVIFSQVGIETFIDLPEDRSNLLAGSGNTLIDFTGVSVGEGFRDLAEESNQRRHVVSVRGDDALGSPFNPTEQFLIDKPVDCTLHLPFRCSTPNSESFHRGKGLLILRPPRTGELEQDQKLDWAELALLGEELVEEKEVVRNLREAATGDGFTPFADDLRHPTHPS